MEITIKGIGHKNGTSGWLKEQLENGSIFFREGISKAGNHGLWLKQKTDGKIRSLYIAGLENSESVNDYLPEIIYTGNDPRFIEHNLGTENIYHLTPAAASAVHKVAQAWCDEKNEERKNDEELNIIVSFN